MSAKKASEKDAEIGRRIKVRRMEIGMSQEKLAAELTLTFQQVQKYEKGQNRVGASRLQDIALALGVGPSYFFDENVTGSPDRNAAFALLRSSYSLRLLRAFEAIEDGELKKKTVELVEQIAQMPTRRAAR